MSIQQVYCTHCTYGTSALEQREGELADRVLGYSARAGSLERNELKSDYRAIERFLYYYLPSDTPPEEKQRLDAASAPRRLFFCPSMGKLQMVGQVAYRQYDTAGRLGSYFAHVLFGDRSAEAWSALDCLRLWDAPWVQEDSSNHPYKLPPLERPDGLWAGASPAIGDDVLIRFLQSSPVSAGGEADRVIGERWQVAPDQQRIDLLVNALQGLLALGTQRRDNILLVVEPGIAALVFYGVARLLPKSMCEGLGFSTYEPNAERLPVTLAATTFFDPHSTDVRSELYRRRGLVINTYLDRVSEAGPPRGNYARFIVEQLLEEGWPTVDRLLQSFESAGAKRPEDLEALAKMHGIVSQVLSASPPEETSWRKSEVAGRYLTRELQYQLAEAPAGWPQLHRVIGTPNHLTVLELVATDRMPAELQRPAQFLLKKFPLDRIAELVSSPLLGRWAKLEALVSNVTTLGRLPDDCQLFEGPGSKMQPSAPSALLPDVLAKLPEPVLRHLYETIDDGQRMAFLQALVIACREQLPPSPALKRLLLEIVTQLDDAQFLEALLQYHDDLTACCPPPEPALARRLGRALYELPDHAKNFEKWPSVLDQWKGYFEHPNLAERRLAEWSKVRSCLLALREPRQKASAGRLERLKERLRPPRPPNLKPLAEALGRAMPRRGGELDELAEVAEKCGLGVPQFKARLELAARHAGVTITYDDEPAAAQADQAPLAGDTDSELVQLRRRREQQARLWELFRELEERLAVYADDSMGNRKLAVLQQIGQVLTGRPDFLAEEKRKIELYFTNGVWPTAAVLPTGKTKHGFKLRKKRSRWIPVIGVGVSLAVLVPLFGYLFLRQRGPPATAKNQAESGHRPASSSTPKAKPADRTPTDRQSDLDRHPNSFAPGTAGRNSGPRADRVHGRPAGPAGEKLANGYNEADLDDQRSTVDEAEPASIPSADDDAMPSNDQPVADTPRRPGGEPLADAARDGRGKDASSPPTAADDDGPQTVDDTVRIVEDSCSLPVLGPKFLQRLPLIKWSAAPEPITLSLRGLAGANQHLGDQFLLRSQPRSDGLAIAFGAADDDANTLAMLIAGDHDLSFQWVEAARSVEGAEQARRCLRRCVLEVIGPETNYLSLAAPLRQDSDLGLQNGNGTLDLRNLPNAEFPLDADDELFLGYGTVEVERGQRITFGEAQPAAARIALADLPEHYQRSDALIELSRQGDRGNLLTLNLVLPDNKPGADAKQMASARRALQKLLRDKRSLLESRLTTMQDKQTISEAVELLAKALKIQDRPTVPPGGSDKTKTDAYKREVDLTILTPVKAREAQLKQFDSLCEHAGKLSAAIYRQVEPGLFVPYLILGDPDKPAKVEAADDDRDEDD